MQAWYSAKKAAGFSDDLQGYECLISRFVKSGNFDTADRFYEEMVSSGITPNTHILENMIEGLCKRNLFAKSEEFFNFILDSGWEISGLMVEKLMGLYYQHGKVEEMEGLLLTLLKSNQCPEVLSKVHRGIIRMYAILDRLDDVEYSVGRMLKQGITFICPADVEKVICSYFRQAAYDRLDLFLERIKDSYKFTRSNYDLLIAGYRRAGLSEKLDMVMNEMKLAGFL